MYIKRKRWMVSRSKQAQKSHYCVECETMIKKGQEIVHIFSDKKVWGHSSKFRYTFHMHGVCFDAYIKERA